ncbi:hypothetical protein RDE2_25060 [Rhodococcus sp. RDE2]|nr:hypothetical protein RDE2_25060 [Rhodococcus sp. RDE2]
MAFASRFGVLTALTREGKGAGAGARVLTATLGPDPALGKRQPDPSIRPRLGSAGSCRCFATFHARLGF